MAPQNITIIGSTGSIGQQTLEVAHAFPKKFKIFALAAYKNVDTILEQIKRTKPKIVALYDLATAEILKKKLQKLPSGSRPAVVSGKSGWEKVATHPKTQKIVFASTGTLALSSLLKAIEKQKKIALANKELIVIAGEKIMNLARKKKVTIIPIDSEHCAIFQCLQGENPKNIEKIILTCSGGPFYKKTKAELAHVKAADALRHPTWKLGQKIAIDCATLMNKGFELIEAKYLFNLRADQIEIMIHPESIVHSLVIFKDGNVKAQLSVPDMRLSIAYALAYPERLPTKLPRLELAKIGKLTFQKPDFSILRGPAIAREALKKGQKAVQKLVQVNEKAVGKFLRGEVGFLEILNIKE